MKPWGESPGHPFQKCIAKTFLLLPTLPSSPPKHGAKNQTGDASAIQKLVLITQDAQKGFCRLRSYVRTHISRSMQNLKNRLKTQTNLPFKVQ